MTMVNEPLQPSKESSAILIGEDALPVKPKVVVPKKLIKPLSVAEVVQKTLSMQKKKTSAAEDLFKSFK
mgnify:CR=1 FL=1